MQNTMSIFNDRKQEIEFYFSVMVEIDNENPDIHTIDNTRFYKIMKSNFLLMLYNLVEACIVSGMMEIYEDLVNNNLPQDELRMRIVFKKLSEILQLMHQLFFQKMLWELAVT
jgi:hypothetical protein